MTGKREAGAAPASLSDEEEAARRKAVHNERVKLAATYLNGLAIAVAAIGGLTPILAGSGLDGQDASRIPGKLLGALICLFFSLSLHLTGGMILKRLR